MTKIRFHYQEEFEDTKRG